MLKVDEMTFSYRRNDYLLNKLNFEITPGGVYGLLGKNGSGKSTLLYLMTGLIFPQVGSITYGNVPVGKRTPESDYRRQNRGGKGVSAMMITEKTGLLCAVHVINGDEDVMMIRDDGTIIRMDVREIREVSRHTQGVKLMHVAEGLKVVSACMTQHEEGGAKPVEEGTEV